MISAYAATEAKGQLKRYDFDPGLLGDGHVEVAVDYCGICHSDLSMLDNEWGISAYPFVPGHEVVGRVVALGSRVKNLTLGQSVGVGWFTQSCMNCSSCMSGNHNLCGTAEQTIVGRPGGFANRIRLHASWTVPLPPGLNVEKVGPLFCGGLTVFNPLVQFDVKPTDRVGVVGIGGLGHMALQFMNKWGCEVFAFSSSAGKQDEALRLGAHHVVNSRSDQELGKLTGMLDLILVTANVTLNWPLYLSLLAPKGRLHFVGAVLEPVALPVFPMMLGQKSMSASPLGSPATLVKMLDFCARHKIEPVTEMFPLSQVNSALDHVRSGKARYRAVLKNDLP